MRTESHQSELLKKAGSTIGQEIGNYSGDPLFQLKLKGIGAQFSSESFSFWMICGYLIIEYVRPQSIVSGLDAIPWGQLFLIGATIGLPFDRKMRWVSSAANTLMVLFLAAILLSVGLAEYPKIARENWFEFFGWFVVYFLIINIVCTERRLFVFVLIFLAASFKLSFFGARTWAMRGFGFTDWGIMGPPGPFQNSGELSIQMLIAGAIGFHVAAFLKPHVSRLKFWLVATIPVTAAMTVLGASSRGAQLGLASQIGGAAFAGKRRNKLKMLLAIAVVGVISYSLLPDVQKARFEAIGNDKTSEQRMLYWKHGVDMIKDHPVLGVGFFNFAPYYAEHFPEDVLFEFAQLPHNIFVQVGTDAGLVGLALFLALIVTQFLILRRVRMICEQAGRTDSFSYRFAKGLRLALWGYLIAGQFVTVTYYPFFWINLSMAVALLNITRSLATPDSARDARAQPRQRGSART